MAKIAAIVSAILLCSVKFGIFFPITIRTQDFNFLEAMLFGAASGALGVGVFMFAGEFLNKWIDIIIDKLRGKQRKPRIRKKFSKRTRQIVRLKNKYGLVGIAFLSPVFLSIPVGVFLAVRYFSNRKLVFTYMMGGVLLWSLIFALAHEGVKFAFPEL